MEATCKTPHGYEIKFSDKDVVNPDDFYMDYDAYLLHDHGFVVGVVFARCEQDAMDELADSGRLDRYQITDEDMKDYGEDEDGVMRLGNASEPFDAEAFDHESLIKLPKVKFSFAACFEASKKS